MAKKETAEEKLLKIMQAKKKASGASAAPAVPQKPVRRISITARQINMLLLACVVVSALFLFYEIKSGVQLVRQQMVFSADKDVPKDTINLLVPQLKSISYYLDKMSYRNIFQPYEKKSVSSSDGSGQTSLERRMSKYKLVGIAWLDLPESASVMIEDTTTRLTHFLKEGDTIDDVTVKAIYTDRVLFGYENEEIVIKL